VGSRPGNEEDICELWACLELGACPALQELDMGYYPCSGDRMGRYLRQGLPCCPDLRRLRLSLLDAPAVVALAAALEQGLYPKLEVLGVYALSENAGEVVAAALRAFPRPGLRELDLDVVSLGVGVAAALQSGACCGLTRLNLMADHFGESLILAEFVDTFRACPHLQELSLDVRRGEGGDSLCRALVEAVRDGGVPCLKNVHLFSWSLKRDSTTALAKALAARAGRLCFIEVSW
jgi:hypothetical protein